MKFKYMNKEAWLLDEDFIYKGIVKRKWFRHVFIPNSHVGGFSYQYVKRKDIGKILFRNEVHIVASGLGSTERIGDEIDPDCDYCLHRKKDFYDDEPCKSCTEPNEDNNILGFELDEIRFNELNGGRR